MEDMEEIVMNSAEGFNGLYQYWKMNKQNMTNPMI